MTILAVEDLCKDFGGVHAIQGLSFQVRAGSIHSIIGPNGAGKTTLFNLITGLYAPSRGRIAFLDEPIAGQPPHRLAGMGLLRTFQNLQVFDTMTATENVMVGRHLHILRGLVPSLLRLPGIVRSDRDARERSLQLLDFVGLSAYADMPAGAMPYGALKRLEIARALAGEPKLLLLDEPAAGCNATETKEIDTLIQRVAAAGITVVLVEHDMSLVMGISDHILVLDYGRKLAEGTAAQIRANPAVIEAYLGTEGADAVPLAADAG
ncbi:MAG: ABC transporter ATP-binding protein [Rhodospirillaceae bacterium]|nr:ABC transporter ATP-binding protein [Rhodospirillaceae bacterium]